MNIGQEISRIQQAKESIRNAIIAKGVDVPAGDLINTYAEKVAAISAGGGGGSDVEYGVIDSNGNFQPLDVSEVPPVDGGDAVDAEIVMYDNGDYPDPVGNGQGKYRVRFFDYDGTVLKTVYTDGGAVTAPAVPEHERLLFQEWNNDFDNITSDLDVGAIYTTKSGMSEFDFDLNAQTGLTVYFAFNLVSGTVTVDWGDGSTETFSTIGNVSATHLYSTGGEYTVKVATTGDWHLRSNAFRNGSAADYTLISACIVGQRLNRNTYCFSDHKMLKFLTLDTGVTACQAYTCWGTLALVHVNIPRQMTVIQQQTFTQGLQSITLPSTLTTLGLAAIDGCKLTDIVIPDAVNSTINLAVRGSYISSLRLPSSATAVENPVASCTLLKNLYIPEGYTDLKALCYGCALLPEVTIPSTVTSITSTDTMKGAVSLSKITCKAQTPPTLDAGAFVTTGQLKEIIVPAGCGEAYKAATNWSTFADIIKEEE